jgi:hypothetical protein
VEMQSSTLEAGSALRLPALAAAAAAGGAGGGGGVGDGEDGDGDANAEKRAARSTRCGSEGKVGAGAGAGAGAGTGAGGAAAWRGRSSSMAWEVGSPSSAVKEPPLPPPPPPLRAADEAGPGVAGISAAWISPPAAGSSCGGGERWRIGAAEAYGARGAGWKRRRGGAKAVVLYIGGPPLRREVACRA